MGRGGEGEGHDIRGKVKWEEGERPMINGVLIIISRYDIIWRHFAILGEIFFANFFP
jgi:hypothetical protein